MKLTVVINTDLGWDNIVAIFDRDKFTKQQLQEVFNTDDGYVVKDWHQVTECLDEFYSDIDEDGLEDE